MVHRDGGVAVSVQLSDGLEILEQLGESVGERHPHHRALMAERTVGDLPPPVERADKVFGGHAHVGEEHLVEVHVVALVHRGEGPALDSRQIGGNEQSADSLVFRRIRVGADEREDHVGIVGARGPHLLSVDDEVVAVELSAGGQPGQIRTRPRLTHAQRGGDVRAQDGRRPAPLLLVGAERQQRRRDDADALRVEAVIDASPRQLVAMDELLQDASVAAAELRWVARQEPPVVELQALPPARPLRDMRRRTRPLGGLRLGRQVLVKELTEFSAKVLDLGIEGELHGATVSST
jgi:hypothetical protein